MPSANRPPISVRSINRVTKGEPRISRSDRSRDDSTFERTSSISELNDSELVVTIHMSVSRSGSSGMNTAACLRMEMRMRQMSSLE